MTWMLSRASLGKFMIWLSKRGLRFGFWGGSSSSRMVLDDSFEFLDFIDTRTLTLLESFCCFSSLSNLTLKLWSFSYSVSTWLGLLSGLRCESLI